MSGSKAMPRTKPPEHNELELSLFGPGVGECAVVHLGAGNWMVVDSCLDANGKSVALTYLASLEVDIATQVKLIVATHWHDDHIRGIAQLLREASSARFACSAALRREEFMTLVAADENFVLIEHKSGISEFSEVLRTLQARPGEARTGGPDHWASDGMRLFYHTNPCPVEVYALSPSSQSITDALGGIARLVPSRGQIIRKFPCISPNDVAVVLLVSTEALSFLLGSDLETGRHPRCGWKGVVSSSRLRPRTLSMAYKVAHHGSENADLREIWTDLLTAKPYALLAPFAKGPSPLPSKDDVLRMKRSTDKLYCTAWPPGKSPPRRDNAVERTMREILRSHRATRKTPGQIRLRGSMLGGSESISVGLFDYAVRL